MTPHAPPFHVPLNRDPFEAGERPTTITSGRLPNLLGGRSLRSATVTAQWPEGTPHPRLIHIGLLLLGEATALAGVASSVATDEQQESARPVRGTRPGRSGPEPKIQGRAGWPRTTERGGRARDTSVR